MILNRVIYCRDNFEVFKSPGPLSEAARKIIVAFQENCPSVSQAAAHVDMQPSA